MSIAISAAAVTTLTNGHPSHLLQVLMLSDVGSQWFLAGATLCAVLQQTPSLIGNNGAEKAFMSAREQMSLMSILVSASGMVASLALKMVGTKKATVEVAKVVVEEKVRFVCQ